MSKSRKKAPGFYCPRGVLYMVSIAAAAFGVDGWRTENLDTTAYVLMGLTALSAFVVPLSIEVLGKGWGSLLALAPALVFGSLNAYSIHHAVEVRIEAPRMAAHAAGQLPTTKAFADAQAAVLAHAPLVLTPDMPKGRVEMQQASWDKAHAALIDAEARALANVKALPAYTPMVGGVMVWIVSGAIDVSLALGLAGIALTRSSIQRKLDAAKPQKGKAKKRKPQPKAHGWKGSAQDLPVGYFKPTLVASND